MSLDIPTIVVIAAVLALIMGVSLRFTLRDYPATLLPSIRLWLIGTLLLPTGWMLYALRLLVPLRRFRGSALDPFGWTIERRAERQLIADYVAQMSTVAEQLEIADFDIALALAKLPEGIRGFGHVKEKSVAAARVQAEALLQKVLQPAQQETLDAISTTETTLAAS